MPINPRTRRQAAPAEKPAPENNSKPEPKKPGVLPPIGLAMAAILVDIEAIAKTREQQGFKFRGIDDCYDQLHPIFAAHGVTCLPFVEKVETSSYVNSKGNTVFKTVLVAGYRFTAADGSMVEAKSAGEATDFSDKATAKAMSYAHKYALIQTFLIPVKDLPDAERESTIDPRALIEELMNKSEDQQGTPEGAEAHKAAVDLEKKTAAEEPAEHKRMQAEAKAKEEAAKKAKKAEAEYVHPPIGEEPAKPAKSSKPARPPADDTPLPGAEAPVKGTWKDLKITPEMVSHPRYTGKTLGELSKEELTKLKTFWAEKPDNQETIKNNPEKSRLKAAVLEATK